MLRAIVFHGKKQFTAEYYSTEIKNRSYGANQANGYYKGYGNELRYAIISDRTFRINSGLFTVQGRQCAVVLGTQEDVLVPAQEQEIKGYIIARINTNVLTGDNVELDYKLGTNSSFPTLVQQETYSIDENTSAIYELPLYSFTIYRSITNVVRMIKPIKNMQVQIDDSSLGVSDYLYENGLYIRKIDNKYYEFYKFDGENLSKLNVNADYINGNTLEVALQNKADLVNGKLPVSQLPETGITADTANAVAYGTGQTYSGDKIVEIDNKNLYHLGAFDVYPYNNDNKKVLRKTGYIKLDGSENWSAYSAITGQRYAVDGLVDDIKITTAADVATAKTTSSFSIVSANANWGNISNSIALQKIDDSTVSRIYILNTDYNTTTNISGFKAWLSQNPIIIEYELSSAYQYTEDVIPEATILPLDTNMANKIRQKVVDGLNLFNVNSGYSIGGSISNLVINGTQITVTINNIDPWFRIDNNVLQSMGLEIGKTYTISTDNSFAIEVYMPLNVGSTFVYNGNIDHFEIENFTQGTHTFNIMLNEGTHAYSYSEHNQKEHITNEEALLVKNEYNKTLNLFNINSMNAYYYIDANGGYIYDSDYSYEYASDIYIPVNNSQITFTFDNLYLSYSDRFYRVGCYDENKTHIQRLSGVPNGTTLTLILPAGTSYIRLSINTPNRDLYKFMLNEGSEAKTYQEWNGDIVHMKDLEYYGSRPAVASANFIEDWSTWSQNSSTYNPGNISAARQQVSFLPLGSHNSIIEARAEYVSGTTDFVECRVSVMDSSSYANINFYNINTTHPTSGSGTYSIYGPNIVNGSGGSYYRSKSTTFKVTIKDMYGNVYTKNYTINYAIHQSQE